MTTILVDDDVGCMAGTLLPPPPGYVPPPIAVSLARGFDSEPGFYVMDDKPIALWADWDYAEDWSSHPIREIHPFLPIFNGNEITEDEFRARVRAIHRI